MGVSLRGVGEEIKEEGKKDAIIWHASFLDLVFKYI